MYTVSDAAKREDRNMGKDEIYGVYAVIDPEIRYLVALLNEQPGIVTEYSCAGHDERGEGYVRFSASSQDALLALVRRLPALSWKAGIVANQYQWTRLWLDVSLAADGHLCYILGFAGFPIHMQRQLIGRIEEALTA